MTLPDAAPAPFEIAVLPDVSALAEAAARQFALAARDAIADRGVFRVALSGGSTPGLLYGRLTRPLYRRSIPWERTRFFWGDERCVGPDDARSNYRLAREKLLDPLKIPAERIFRIKGEEPPAAAAAQYEETLRRQFRGRPARLDLVLLGLGADGHTASLFPGSPALAENRRLVAPNPVARLSEWRVTLTYRAVNAARRVLFLVSGEEKSAPAERILKKRPGYEKLPASGVSPRRGSLLWLLDEAAASRL